MFGEYGEYEPELYDFLRKLNKNLTIYENWLTGLSACGFVDDSKVKLNLECVAKSIDNVYHPWDCIYDEVFYNELPELHSELKDFINSLSVYIEFYKKKPNEKDSAIINALHDNVKDFYDKIDCFLNELKWWLKQNDK